MSILNGAAVLAACFLNRAIHRKHRIVVGVGVDASMQDCGASII